MAFPILALLAHPFTAIPTAVIGVGYVVCKVIDSKNRANELNHIHNENRLNTAKQIVDDKLRFEREKMSLMKKTLYFTIGLSVLLLIFGITYIVLKKAL